jgi:ATP-binding protein involved in chromosome partitioning
MAQDYDVEVLGSLPLDIRIREQADSGTPTVAAMPESDIAARYREIARNASLPSRTWNVWLACRRSPTISP